MNPRAHQPATGVAAIVVAGGRGVRFGAKRPKTLAMLRGRPIVRWAVEAFWTTVERVVLVAPTGLERTLASAAGVPVVTVTGGERRQDSVRAGLAALPPSIDIVLVHDAARPFVMSDTIEAVIEATREHGAAIPVESVHSTVKRIDAAGFVRETVARESLRLAQTPQGAKRELLETALARADREMTDESAALEAAGIPVFTVLSSPLNVKITTHVDLVMLDACIARADEWGASRP